MRLLDTDIDILLLLRKNVNPYKLDVRLKDYIGTSNFSNDIVFHLEPGKNQKKIWMFKIWKWRMSMSRM